MNHALTSAALKPLPRHLLLATCTALGAAMAAAPAQAALDQWGTWSEGFTMTCSPPPPVGPQICGTILTQAKNDNPLGVLSGVALNPGTPSPGVDFAAQAELQGGLNLPALKAKSIAEVPDRFIVASSATGIQAVAYQGSTPIEMVLDIQLSGTAGGFGSIDGFVGVYDADNFSHFGEFHGTRLANTVFKRTASIDQAPQALHVTLAPGDEVYIWAALFTDADSRDGTLSFADASHTLTMSVRDATGLVAIGAVPEPASAALAAAGLLGLAAALRRRRPG